MKHKYKEILSSMRDRPRTAGNILAYRAVLVLVLGVAVGVSFMWRQAARTNIEYEEVVKTASAEIDAQKKQRLQEQSRHEQLRLRAEKLPLERVNISNVNGDMFITGRVRNHLGRDVADIELTVYCKDAEGQTVVKNTFTAPSHDGLPLGNGQFRKFRLKVDQVPPSARDVVILVTDIKFEDSRGEG